MRWLGLLLISITAHADWAVVKDLRGGWLQYASGNYQPLEGRDSHIRTIYFPLDAGAYKGHHLLISGPEAWQLFINGNLITSSRTQHFNLDSLSEIYPEQMFIGIHTKGEVSELQTQVVSNAASPVITGDDSVPRPSFFFRDFSILSTAVLLLFFLLLLKTNSQLTLDYFSFAKIFSVQERNENLLASRITSGENLLFYLFCALLTGFLLAVIFHFAGTSILTTRHVDIQSLSQAFLAWLKLSLFILLLLASKLVIVLAFSSLFNFRETISFQFFNFLRFVLFTALVLAGLTFLYFIFRGKSGIFYERLIVLGLLLLSVGSVMVLIKLLARAPFSFFHLFSYLCVSEIIPLVIIIKIFF